MMLAGRTLCLHPSSRVSRENLDVFCGAWSSNVNEVSRIAKELDIACSGRLAAEKQAYMSLPKPGVSSSSLHAHDNSSLCSGASPSVVVSSGGCCSSGYQKSNVVAVCSCFVCAKKCVCFFCLGSFCAPLYRDSIPVSFRTINHQNASAEIARENGTPRKNRDLYSEVKKKFAGKSASNKSKKHNNIIIEDQQDKTSSSAESGYKSQKEEEPQTNNRTIPSKGFPTKCQKPDPYIVADADDEDEFIYAQISCLRTTQKIDCAVKMEKEEEIAFNRVVSMALDEDDDDLQQLQLDPVVICQNPGSEEESEEEYATVEKKSTNSSASAASDFQPKSAPLADCNEFDDDEADLDEDYSESNLPCLLAVSSIAGLDDDNNRRIPSKDEKKSSKKVVLRQTPQKAKTILEQEEEPFETRISLILEGLQLEAQSLIQLSVKNNSPKC
jgi:hypothetical protein